MFPFFNKDFFKSMLEGQKELEIKAPNGAIYRFATNAIDNKTFEKYKKKLEDAVKNNDQTSFDKAWHDMTTNNQFKIDFENELQKFRDELQDFFAETSPFFNLPTPLLTDVPNRSILSEDQIDKQIAHYEDKIKQLQSMKNNMDIEKKKLELRNQIDQNKQLLDQKLEEFSKNLDNDKMKKKLTDEMTELNHVIKKLESELDSLSSSES